MSRTPCIIQATALVLVALIAGCQPTEEAPAKINRLELSIPEALFEQYFSDDSKSSRAVGGAAGVEKATHVDGLLARANDDSWMDVEELSIRGQHCLREPRLCLGIEASGSFNLHSVAGEPPIEFSRLNLSSLSQDDFYFRAELGSNVLSRFGLYPLRHQYVELIVNERTQGLYHAVEKPRSRLQRAPFDSPFIARTSYGEGIVLQTFEPDNTTLDRQIFLDAVSRLEAGIEQLQGQELHDFLVARMDLQSYMEILALFYIFQNSDYEDEIYFYAVSTDRARKIENAESIYFRVLPWDFDQLYDRQSRNRDTKFFSYRNRSPLDRKIRRNRVLRQRYHEVLREMLATRLTDAVIEDEYEKLTRRLEPYLIDRILEPSAWDRRGHDRPYSRASVIEAMTKKRDFTLARRRQLLGRLQN